MKEHAWKNYELVGSMAMSVAGAYGLYAQIRAWEDLKARYPDIRPVLLLVKYAIAAEGRRLSSAGLEALAEIEVEPRVQGTRRQRRTFATRLQKSYRRIVKHLDEGKVLLSSVRFRKPDVKDASVKKNEGQNPS